MNIKIVNILNPAIPDKERLFMKVINDDQLGHYVVFDTTQIQPGRFSAIIRNFFWFADKEIKAGDKIVLYTKSGIDSERKNKDGTTTFFFYWGKEEVLWSESNASAVLGRLSGWENKVRP